jgi:O-antigen/teichoic acid export membrane protein
VALRVALVRMEAGLLWFVVATLLDQVALAVAYVYMAWRKGLVHVPYQWDMDLARRMLADSWPLILSAVAIMAYARIDQVIIGHMLGPGDVGLYSVAVRFSEVWLFVPVVVSASLYPAIFHARREEDAATNVARRLHLYQMMALAGYIVIGVTLVAGDWFVVLLLGAEFAPSAILLKVRLVETVFAAIGVASSGWVIANNLQKTNAAFFTLGLLVNIALNLVLISKYGVIGAPISGIISIVLINLALPLLHPKFRGDAILRLKGLVLLGWLEALVRVRKRVA